MNLVYFSIKICLFCFIDTTVRSGARDALFRAIGGRDARPGEFPFALRVEVREQLSRRHTHVCSAAALTRTAALSAAHCCLPLRRLRLRRRARLEPDAAVVVRHGSAAGTGAPAADDSFGEVLECLRPSARSSLRPLLIDDDVALLRTRALAALRGFARLSALDYRAAFGRRVAVLGFGLTNGSDGRLADTLRLRRPLQAVQALWARCERQPLFPLVCGVERCARRAALCPGDSGGPVLLGARLVGVTSRAPVAINCRMRSDAAHDSYVVSVIPVSVYLDWIADTLATMSKN